MVRPRAPTSASGRLPPSRSSTTPGFTRSPRARRQLGDPGSRIPDDSRGNEWRHATLTYDGVVVEDVGVRPAGESSRVPGNVKMSMRIRFDAFDGRGTFGGAPLTSA